MPPAKWLFVPVLSHSASDEPLFREYTFVWHYTWSSSGHDDDAMACGSACGSACEVYHSLIDTRMLTLSH